MEIRRQNTRVGCNCREGLRRVEFYVCLPRHTEMCRICCQGSMNGIRLMDSYQGTIQLTLMDAVPIYVLSLNIWWPVLNRTGTFWQFLFLWLLALSGKVQRCWEQFWNKSAVVTLQCRNVQYWVTGSCMFSLIHQRMAQTGSIGESCLFIPRTALFVVQKCAWAILVSTVCRSKGCALCLKVGWSWSSYTTLDCLCTVNVSGLLFF